MTMDNQLSILGRIVRQGPQAPLAGDTLTLPVYKYEVLEPAGGLRRGERIDVAHMTADADDPGFAVGSVRRLSLVDDLPPRSTLLFHQDYPWSSSTLWFCSESSPAGDGTSES